MVFVVISNKASIFFVELNTKINAKYYCNILLKNMISEIDTMAKHNEYLFTQDLARAHTAKLTLEILKDKKQEAQSTGAPSLATK